MLYDGNGGLTYGTTSLTGAIPASCNDRGVVAIHFPQNGLQNGSPDGLALVDAAGQVVEFLSYEGTFTATNGPAAGLLSTDIGAAESPSSALGASLQRDALNHWALSGATLGACNGEGAPPPPPSTNTISFSGRLPGDPPLPVGFQDQLFATIRDGSNAVIATTITWSSETPALASIDQDGVMTALAEGAATFRATAADGVTTATLTLPLHVATASTTASYAGNAEFGEPTDGDPSDDFIVRHPEYTASYNPNRGTPNWVAYDLEATHFGAEDRCDCFTFDPDLPSTFPHYTTAEYTGAAAVAGFSIDRGHMTRSFDRTSASTVTVQISDGGASAVATTTVAVLAYVPPPPPPPPPEETAVDQLQDAVGLMHALVAERRLNRALGLLVEGELTIARRALERHDRVAAALALRAVLADLALFDRVGLLPRSDAQTLRNLLAGILPSV